MRSSTHWLIRAHSHTLRVVQPLAFSAPLLARATLGLVFASSGWGKLNNLTAVSEFFSELGIPAPAFHAVLVANTELVCGALLCAGLLTRLAVLPLIATMLVALITAKASEVSGLLELLGSLEFTYVALLVGLFFTGAGRLSLDALLLERHSHAAAMPAHATSVTAAE